MKRILTIFLVVALIFVCGCAQKEYKLPWDHFCYYADDAGGVIELELEEKQYIIDLLNNGNWHNDIAKCPADVKFATQQQVIGYSAEDGIFNDYTQNKSLKISEQDRLKVNSYIGF